MMFVQRQLALQWQRMTLTWWRLCGSRHSSSNGAGPHLMPLPTQAQVVICGGGIMGTSVAYHLSKLGWKDIVLLEQGRLAAGSTRFCAGIVSTVHHLSIELKMAHYSRKLYQQLKQETGVETGYVKTGSISLAQTQDRLISLKRIASRLKIMGIPCELIPPKRVAQLHPFINIHDLVGALHVPEDAVISSADVTLALASAAAANGVQIHERTSVIHVLGQKGCVTGVETDRGMIECSYFVNCAGQFHLALIYDLKVPRWDFQTGRQLRTSPLYDRLDAQGARWMEKHGFERAKFFVPPGKDLLALDQSKTFYKPDWFDIVGAEVKCCKEAVCVIDMSSFTKFEISSTGGQALEVLQYLFSNDLDVPVGHIVHTGMLNHNGGYENDCSIARLNKRSFFMISPTDQQVHCWAWLKKHMPEDSNLFLEDVTWKYTALNLIGPRAMDVLSELSYAPMTPEHFPSLFCKEMSVGYANGIRVMSMTHTGEPGFMLYIPIEYALHVYNEVMNVGQKYGIRNSGYYALRSLRIEKFFAFWGQDLDAFTTPMECGREFRVKLEKGMDFIGRDALMAQKQEGVYKRFTMFILEDHNTDLDLWPWWGEPIYRNGCYVGKTTSSAYSYTLERHVCLGFVQNLDPETGEEQLVTPDFVNRGEYEIDIAGQRFQAKAKLYPFSSLFTSRRRKDEMEFSGFQGK
ncbi:pyruvate dehydrogenase phosphatase regulatory subunit, mitochondrial [Notechis scutatus]|uniref:Pyruvate dehydrogenase phosphatase regulatory subunit, mitochondrial n=1 Tax=Notechis scutatus TaxID=8663 RepID=A0A6J1V5M2_9SAUR|nr:pyruvate dehydrogenase phosphatase regulatory subunit, mitochondrial [Notechis scutatus]